MVRTAAVLTLTWGALSAAAPLKVVVPDFNAVGPSKEKAVFFSEHISGRLSEVGAEVTTQRQLAQVLGIERQRQLLGCAEEASNCLAELANALGTDSVLLGDVAQIGTLFQINLKLISGSDAKVLSTWQARVNDEGSLLDELDKAAFALVQEAAGLLSKDAPVKLRSKGPNARTLAIVPAAVGLVAAATSGVFFALAMQRHAQIPRTPTTALPVDRVQGLVNEGKSFELAAWICAGVATAGIAAAAVLFVLGRPAPIKATVVGTSNAGAVMLWGEF